MFPSPEMTSEGGGSNGWARSTALERSHVERGEAAGSDDAGLRDSTAWPNMATSSRVKRSASFAGIRGGRDWSDPRNPSTNSGCIRACTPFRYLANETAAGPSGRDRSALHDWLVVPEGALPPPGIDWCPGLVLSRWVDCYLLGPSVGRLNLGLRSALALGPP